MVNAEGKIVTADSRMLKGIRGACGNFGVIVEMTVKVYPLPKVASSFFSHPHADKSRSKLGKSYTNRRVFSRPSGWQ